MKENERLGLFKPSRINLDKFKSFDNSRVKYNKRMPKCGELYYYISQSGTISSTKCGLSDDFTFRYAIGNCFKTFSHCKRVLLSLYKSLGFEQSKSGGRVCLNSCHIPREYRPKLRTR